MSRCFVCDVRLNDFDFRACKENCGKCQAVIDELLAEYEPFEDIEYTSDFIQEGVKELPSLEYYDNIEYFDENLE